MSGERRTCPILLAGCLASERSMVAARAEAACVGEECAWARCSGSTFWEGTGQRVFTLVHCQAIACHPLVHEYRTERPEEGVLDD